jgi:hypothetical protein
MHVVRFVLIVGFFLLAASVHSEARAQGPSRYVPPAGPVLPNALNYFRRDVGLLDPYNAFVEPRRQLNQQLGAIVQQERANFNRTQVEIGQVRQSLAAPTGVNAGFMTHGQYFGIRQGQGQPQRNRR